MNVKRNFSLVTLALCCVSASAQRLPSAPERERPPVHLLCDTKDGRVVCERDPGAQWLAGRTPKPQRLPRLSYPARMLSRGLTGWVLVEYTITETGSCEAPRVVEASPPGLFDAVALRVVKRLKYDPPTRGGKLIAVEGAAVRVDYVIDWTRKGYFDGTVTAQFLPIGTAGQRLSARSDAPTAALAYAPSSRQPCPLSLKPRLQGAAPAYPTRAHSRFGEATITVSYMVDEQGNTVDNTVSVIESQSTARPERFFGLFARQASEFVQRLEFDFEADAAYADCARRQKATTTFEFGHQ